MQAYINLNYDFKILNDGIQDPINQKPMTLYTNYESANPAGFRIYLTLKDCVDTLLPEFARDSIILEIKTIGDVDSKTIPNSRTSDPKIEYYANTIYTVRRVAMSEIMGYLNTGDGNTSYGNQGDFNSGSNNHGLCNSGNSNIGNCNSGHCNVGETNSGHQNRGDKNTGDGNIGNSNCGRRNVGNNNIGHQNRGDFNIGDWNKGDFNVGNCNSGNCNLGDYNITDNSNGAFNTEELKIYIFNKPSDWTLTQFHDSKAYRILREMLQISPNKTTVKVKEADRLTDDEKTCDPNFETTGFGVFETAHIPSQTPQERWNDLTEDYQKEVMSLPNFDADIFLKITGIDVNANKKLPAKKKPAAKSTEKKTPVKEKSTSKSPAKKPVKKSTTKTKKGTDK